MVPHSLQLLRDRVRTQLGERGAAVGGGDVGLRVELGQALHRERPLLRARARDARAARLANEVAEQALRGNRREAAFVDEDRDDGCAAHASFHLTACAEDLGG